MGEAYWGLGEGTEGDRWLAQAYATAPESWMHASTEEQIDKLKALLADSPLKYVQGGGV
jgi:hypothetical protein